MTAVALLLFAGALLVWPGGATVARRFAWLTASRPPPPARAWPSAVPHLAATLGGVSLAVLVGGV
ncbi:MAG: hypothetical protein QOI78_7018, partial [Actinomycetota bacterium]|nr:hypothetical protein [Actinomycetota bacterium]